MKTLSFDADRAVQLGLVLTSFLIAVTCASARPHEGSGPASSDPAPLASAPLASAAPEPLPEPLPSEPSADAAPGPAEHLSLAHFFGALRDMKDGDRVRVLFLGDSHTAADFLPQPLREALQSRFGNGGPGFVAVGLDKYRHAGLLVKSEGRWRREPRNPAQSSRFDDGVFGLSGVRSVPESLDARTEIELLAGAVSGQANWELMYRAKPGARLTLSVDAKAEQRVDATSGRAGPAGSPIRRVKFESAPRSRVKVANAAGSAQVFGLLVESAGGGVVVDTLGINGARAATALAWDETTFVAEVRARAPALAVVAYGTNEAAGALPAERYEKHLAELVARLRKAVPELDCILLGPTDMADASGQSSPRVAELDAAAERAAGEAKCGYFSLYHAMGGEGSMARWMKETPALAAPDRVHLTAKGYEKVGAKLASELLQAYDRFATAP